MNATAGLGDQLLDHVAPPGACAVVGVAGTGKSGLLDFVAAGLTGRGVAVLRLAGSRSAAGTALGALRASGVVDTDTDTAADRLLGELGRAPWLLAVDDAHLLDDASLAVVAAVAQRACALGGGVVVAYRPAAGREPLDALGAVLTAARGPLVLGPWSVPRVAGLPAVGGDAERAARLVEATGGNPRLTAILARSDVPVPAAAAAAVAAEIEALPAPARILLETLTTGPDLGALSGVAPAGLGELVAAGLARPDGGLVPLVAAILDRDGAGPAGPDRAPVTPAGPGAAEAERAWRAGDLAGAIAAADRVLVAGTDTDHRAAAVAAAGAGADGELLDAADRWRRIVAALGGTRGVWAGARAALAAALAGDLDAAAGDLAATRALLPAPAPRGVTVLLDGVAAVVDGLGGEFEQATARLAAVAASAVPHDPLAPAQWDELAATIAAAGGDGDGALARLSAVGDRKPTARRILLAAWLDLRAGRVEDAAAALAAVDGAPLLRRDAVLAAAVAVGLARRSRDRAALADTWRRFSPVVAGADVEPLLVDAWGELSVGAALVAPAEVEGYAAMIAAAVGRAGRPAWLEAAQRWWWLERAVALGDAPAAAAAAADLGRLARDGQAARLAAAAQVWAQVMVGAVDGAAVTEAASALAAGGRAWAAAALYRTAAAHSAEPAVAKALLRRGRRLHTAARPGTAVRGGGLTAREKDVGTLIVDGLTYREIGSRLYISPKTVEQHVARLRQKLAATTRAQLIAALRARLVPTEQAS